MMDHIYQTVNYKHKIGEGSSGTVYSVEMNEKPVAMKLYHNPVKELSFNSSFIREVTSLNILNRKSCPYILPLEYIGFIERDNLDVCFFPQCLCSLDKVLNSIRTNQLLIRRIFAQLLEALKTVHNSGIVHRDVKAENILLTDEYHIMLSDFTTSRYLTLGDNRVDIYLNQKGEWFVRNKTLAESHQICKSPPVEGLYKINRNLHGHTPDTTTLRVRPPETLTNPNWLTYSSDVWSATITAIEMLKGNPFMGDNPVDRYYDVVSHRNMKDFLQYYLRDVIGTNDALLEVLSAGLTADPAERPSADQLLQYPYFREGSHSLNTLPTLSVSPIQRVCGNERVCLMTAVPAIHPYNLDSLAFLTTPRKTALFNYLHCSFTTILLTKYIYCNMIPARKRDLTVVDKNYLACTCLAIAINEKKPSITIGELCNLYGIIDIEEFRILQKEIFFKSSGLVNLLSTNR